MSLEKYGEYRPSGYDWLGEIPAHWKLERIKDHLRRIEPRNPGNQTVLSLYRDLGIVPKDSRDDNPNVTAEDTSHYKYVRVGDFVVNKMKAWQGSVAVSGYEGIVSPAYYVYRFTDDVFDRRYFHYLLRGGYRDAFHRLSGGIRIGQWDLASEDLEGLPVLIPPLPEQTAIAEYLDGRCTAIEEIISEVQAGIEEYRQLKASMISEAVLHGTDRKARRKDSGVEWIGEIPSHWEVRRVKDLFREVSEEGREDLPVLTVSINTGVSDRELSEEEQARSFSRIEDRSQYKHVLPGDLTYNRMRAWQGAFGAVRVEGLVSPAYEVARPTAEMDSRYMEAFFRMPAAIDEMRRFSRGITDFRLRLYWQEFGRMKVCVPPVEEQRSIADSVDGINAKIDSLIAEKKALIADMEAYRKSLIFETTTGKRKGKK